MSEINDGGPAFAALGVGPAGDVYHQADMSLREWYAGMALAGGLAVTRRDDTGRYWQQTPDGAAERAFAIADAMVAASRRAR